MQSISWILQEGKWESLGFSKTVNYSKTLNYIFWLKGMERTSRGKFEGGDADWEEKKLRSYANSEVRLVEIQEKLCADLAKGEDQV